MNFLSPGNLGFNRPAGKVPSSLVYVVGGSERELLALHMVLSFSRKAAVVWAESKDMLA
jgi:hypothetical protein